MPVKCTDYRALCNAAGWFEYADSDTLQNICGDRAGIAHAATLQGDAAHNDSVYATWRDCYWEAIATDPPDQRRAISEGWCIMFSDTHGWQIQCDDEQGVFTTDEDAADFVDAEAANGSHFHRDCLAFIGALPGYVWPHRAGRVVHL
jgi:hypothetical protein